MDERDRNSSVGARLRGLRRERGLSLAKVASQVGISASFLSQVETGKVHPSVASLLSIANLFGVSLDDLFGRSTQEAIGRTQEVKDFPPLGGERLEDAVTRAEDVQSIELETGIIWRRLSDGGGRAASALLVTYEPGGRDTLDGRLKRHAAWEFGYLLEGSLCLKLDFDEIELHAGDSFHFDSERPHLFENRSEQVARGVWFVLHKPADVALDRHGIDRRAVQAPL